MVKLILVMHERNHATAVMPGLVPGIHALLLCGTQDVDGRVKPGHDDRKGGVR